MGIVIAHRLRAVARASADDTKPGKLVRIGRLSPLSAETDRLSVEAFRRGMAELGWVEGKTFTIVSRFADGQASRLEELATQLAQEPVDLILAGSSPGVAAAKKATRAIPIVMVTTADPVSGGLVASLARPGGNVTGVTALGQALNAKRLELLRETVPGVGRVAVLASRATPYLLGFRREHAATSRALNLELPIVEVTGVEDLEPAFARVIAERARAVMVLTDPFVLTHRRRIVALAAKNRLPAVYGEREFVEAGGLMFYGASLTTLYRDAAVYADKILKGARPADLPVEEPTKLDLVVNLRTARTLGIEIPSSVLLRADRVLE